MICPMCEKLLERSRLRSSAKSREQPSPASSIEKGRCAREGDNASCHLTEHMSREDISSSLTETPELPPSSIPFPFPVKFICRCFFTFVRYVIVRRARHCPTKWRRFFCLLSSGAWGARSTKRVGSSSMHGYGARRPATQAPGCSPPRVP